MTKHKYKNYFYFSSFIALLFFIPIFNNSNLGSDWDSYALIGTYRNYMEYNLYIPSRPPGFPIYEFLIGIFILISENLSLSQEQVILIFQFISLISFNYLIYLFFNKTENNNFIVYLIATLSPIYLISGLSVIDYFFGSLFGFTAFYIHMYKQKTKMLNILIVIALTISISTRLSNVIFLVVLVAYEYFKNKNIRNTLIIFTATFLASSVIYLIFYSNLFSFYKSAGIYQSWSDMLCIFNLTNTDHDLLGRVGRFVLKQIPYLGTIGSILLVINIFNFKFDIKNKNFYFLLIFIFFELSFLRLPTEEGHLLPAFVAFMILLGQSKNKALLVILIFTFLSNFYNINFYEVDEMDSANEIYFSFNLANGYFIEDLATRNEIAIEKDFHYKNSQISLNKAWINGCPN